MKIKYILILFFLMLPFNNQALFNMVFKGEGIPSLKSEVITVHPTISYPGDTVLIKSTKAGTVVFNEKKYQLTYNGEEYIAFMPISIDQPLGVTEASLLPPKSNSSASTENGNKFLNAELTIEEKKFSTQYLEVTEEQQEMTRNSAEIAKDREKFYNALANPTIEPLFTGPFLKPLTGRTTTIFGYTRFINGILDSRHLAIDIAASEGTPIYAPNNGRVVLADYLYLSGNRVIIDHGIELFSSFSHMSKLNVNAGDEVKKGDIIGYVGSTGFSTGPHLHHAMYVHGYAVNPEQFFNSNPLDW